MARSREAIADCRRRLEPSVDKEKVGSWAQTLKLRSNEPANSATKLKIWCLHVDNVREAREALHSYTHAGLVQVGRRFTGADLAVNYSEEEILELARVSTTATFTVNNLVTGILVLKQSGSNIRNVCKLEPGVHE